MWSRFYSFWLYPSLALALLGAAAALEPERSAVELVWLVPAGVFIWTALEYCLHRFLFHWRPSNPRMRRFLAKLHLRHHGDPRNPRGILVQPQFSVPVSGFLLAFAALLAGSLFSAAALMTGVWIGFLYYEAVHYRVHLSKRGGHLLDRQRRSHFHHHFVDDERCYGVTSPLWDWVFRTHKNAG